MRTPLFALRHVLIMHGLCLFPLVCFGAVAVTERGPVRAAAWGVALAAVLLWGAVVQATLVPRGRGPVVPRPDGSVVVESPLRLVVLVVAAWVVMLAAVLGWVVVAITDLGSLESPGFTLVMMVGGVASLPDLVRLLRGRLHRWRVVADDDGIRYRGYHTDRVLTWSEVSAVRSPDKPPGVTVERKDGGPALLVPAIAFDVLPDAIAQAVRERRTRL